MSRVSLPPDLDTSAKCAGGERRTIQGIRVQREAENKFTRLACVKMISVSCSFPRNQTLEIAHFTTHFLFPVLFALIIFMSSLLALHLPSLYPRNPSLVFQRHRDSRMFDFICRPLKTFPQLSFETNLRRLCRQYEAQKDEPAQNAFGPQKYSPPPPISSTRLS